MRVALRYSALVWLVLGAGAGLRADVVLQQTSWREIPAYRFSDGRSEVVVVPRLGGRAVEYKLINGINFLWTGEPGSEHKPEALYWGGDKTYIGPHSMWNFTQPRAWPPPSPDTAAHEAEVLPGPRLRTSGPVWPGYGARVSREYRFEASGELVIHHRIDAVPGPATLVAVWIVTQTIPSDAVYVPLNPASPYKDGVFWFGFGAPPARRGASNISDTLLQIRPVTGAGWKLGADPKQPALATVKDAVAFVQRSDPQKGQYPEGADGAGFSVEVYHHDLPPPREYTELELLSPLRRMDQGAELVTRWSLHTIEQPVDPPAIERLLHPPSPVRP